MGPAPPVVELTGVVKAFLSGRERVVALEGVTAALAPGRVTGLVGPDGAGKTTWMRLCAGLLVADAGEVRVLGLDPAVDGPCLRARIGYMPQRFGLYEDLTVRENLLLYADLHGVAGPGRAERVDALLEATGLAPFPRRLAGALSGGMKQKLGLACVLVHPPELLLLDEPTVGVDPVARRELWAIVGEQVASGTSVLVSTAYLDEAERCDEVLLMHRGRILDRGRPAELRERVDGRTWALPTAGGGARALRQRAAALPGVLDATVQGGRIRLLVSEGRGAVSLPLPGGGEVQAEPVAPRFEDAFLALLAERPGGPAGAGGESPAARASGPVGSSALAREIPLAPSPAGGTAVIELRDVVRRFGRFEAVRGLSLRIPAGEVYGLLGPNGAGKSTIMKMLTGLLPPSEGEARVLGLDLAHAPSKVRGRVGYMSQRFSLYQQLSVEQNLQFFAGVYGLGWRARRRRIPAVLEEFELGPYRGRAAGDLPLGFKQRLALAAALMHGPEIVFLDEPTSGVDPLARREFWQRINTLAAGGVTVLVTTHFMEEAEYCDRMGIVYAGRVEAEDSPEGLKERFRSPALPDPTLEDVFVGLVSGRPDPRA